MTRLYHGSHVLVPVLEPRHGYVYAAERAYAIPFALVFHPDERGRCQWDVESRDGKPLIALVHGSLDPDGVGYLYELTVDGFELDRAVWRATAPVTPLGHEVIRGADYADCVVRR